jgi:hypothetical protein
MRTVGVDLAAQPKKTGIAWIDWSDDGQGSATFATGAGDDAILMALRDPDTEVIGFDVPLGWPDRFVDMLVAHHDQKTIGARAWPELYEAARLRTTDHWIQDVCGANPMSVSANMIGATAMRAAWLLSQAQEAGVAIDRSGMTGKVVEVYPGAALRRWGLSPAGYKSGDAVAAHLQQLFTALTRGTHMTLASAVSNDHELDALVCAVVARMARTGLTHDIPAEHRDVARREGWIHLPVRPLAID